MATIGLFGGSVGAAPLGSAIGFVGGSAAGFALWALVDGFKTPDLLGVSLAGLALGGITEWLVRGIDSRTGDGAEVRFTVPLRIGR